MARLTVAPHGFERTSLRSQKLPEQASDPDTTALLEIDNSDKNVTQTESTQLRIEEEIQKAIDSHCQLICEPKQNKLVAENARLSATISQLQETIQKHEMEIQSLRDENKLLQESQSLVPQMPQMPPQKEFNTRLAEIEKAVTHGLTHTLNALQGIRNGPLPESQNTVNFSDEQTPEPAVELSGKLLAITATPSEPVQEISEKDDIRVKQENTDDDYNSKTNKIPGDFMRKVRVKVEGGGASKPHKHEPRSSDNYTKAARTKEVEDDFEEITFFQKPSASKVRGSLGINDKLSHVLRVKREPETYHIKPEPKESNDFRPSKMKVKREFTDENSDVSIKEEPSKRRKALAPVTRNNNSRYSSSGSPTKKIDHKAFDFVEKSTLIEQSRSSWKKSSS